jgi:hypothetical protein
MNIGEEKAKVKQESSIACDSSRRAAAADVWCVDTPDRIAYKAA